MSIIKLEIEAKIFLELTEGEAGALDAICGYGPKEFIKWFERNMGKHYIAPYKEHLETLFDKARTLNREVKSLEKFRQENNYRKV